MNNRNWDHDLMDSVLGLLEQLRAGGISAEDCISGDPKALAALPDTDSCRAACQQLRLMDEMPGGFLIYRADGDEAILYANKALLRIFQCESSMAFLRHTGGSFQGMIYPDDLEEVEESIRRQIADSQFDLDYVEYRIMRPDGSIRWIEDYGHFIPNKRFGDIFYVFLGDATEKRDRWMAQQEFLLGEKDRKLLNVIEQYDQERALIDREYLRQLEIIEGLSINYEAIFYIDLAEDHILPYRTNARAEQLFGRTTQARAYSWFVEIYVPTWVHPEDREMMANAMSVPYIRQQLSGGDTFYINYRAQEGDVIQYLQMRVVNVRAQASHNQLVMGMRRVDEELRREMEQKQLVAEALYNANLAIDAKNTFLSNMSHDMRTPLNAVLGFTALAKKNLRDPAALAGYLERVEESGRMLQDLIDKVLEMSWSGSGEMRLQEARCDLRQILREVYTSLQPQAAAKRLDFVLEDDAVVHSSIYSDPGKLRQALLHLVKNAVTYTKAQGRVRVTLEEQQLLPNNYAAYRLQVADSGIGISEEFLAHIFEPFAREKNTTLSGVHGVGLGLTIVKNIIEMMGGNIEIQSTVGQGSVFIITFRFKLQPTSAAQAPGAAVPAQSLRLLLVEDNEINLEIETELLEDQGFAVESAADGSLGVEKLCAAGPGHFDVVLMDLQMPVMDGYQAARAIRRLADPALAGIPIIALSANVFESDIRASLESGMNAHLAKPLDMPQLLRTIQELTGRSLTLKEEA